MKKRILPILLSLALVLPLLPSALAVQASVEDMAQVLSALDIMTGNESGDLMLSRNVTRAEFTKLVVAASPMGDNVGASTTVSPYPDVPYSLWCAPYVEAAVRMGYVNGYLDGTFHPGEDITLAMGVTMAVRLLGYTDADFSGAWPAGQMTLYHNLDLDKGISIGQDAPMTRQDAMCLFYNLLTARTKTGQVYLNTLGHALTPAGEIDRVGLINAAMDGPVVMEEGWQSKVSFDVSNATVYRSGKPASLSALQTGDVIYFSKSMRTLWAYSNKVTGLYQAASPSASSPSAVTVAGKTYPIETASAAYALSNLGEYKTGDTVTLLLGRDGGVAAVARRGQVGTNLVGIVAAVSDSGYTDSSGNAYTAKTVTLTGSDGSSYSYPVETGSPLKAGDLVQVTLTASGEAQVSRLNQTSTSGKVSGDGAKIGSTPLAHNVEILDANGDGLALKIYPSRLAGMTLGSKDVKYVRTNAAGEIDILILNDATGDLYSYGVLTSAEEVKMGMAALMGVYQYDVGGISYTSQRQNSVFNVKTGPVKLQGSLYSPDKISALTSVRLESLDSLTAVSRENVSIPVADNVAVYTLEDKTYLLSSVERVQTGYSLTGYYDKPAAEGGRIRVVVAKAN